MSKYGYGDNYDDDDDDDDDTLSSLSPSLSAFAGARTQKVRGGLDSFRDRRRGLDSMFMFFYI